MEYYLAITNSKYLCIGMEIFSPTREGSEIQGSTFSIISFINKKDITYKCIVTCAKQFF